MAGMTYHMVADNIMVTLLGEELDGKAADIAHGIGTALLATGGAGPEEHLGLLADAVEELGAGEVGDVIGDTELSPGAGTLGVDNSIGRVSGHMSINGGSAGAGSRTSPEYVPG